MTIYFPVNVYTDHVTLKGMLMHPEAVSAKVGCWFMMLAEYDYEISFRA